MDAVFAAKATPRPGRVGHRCSFRAASAPGTTRGDAPALRTLVKGSAGQRHLGAHGRRTHSGQARPGRPAPAAPARHRPTGTGAPRERGHPHSPPLEYRRHNCCLYYRVPGAGYCDECVLNRRECTPPGNERRRVSSVTT
ncbi:(2Fe-2S)-binding protein [Streptomyces sp. Isolate_219]|uniref:(2Fe-2S)-binding protein n=1 Tax=Streptomyces sp. Isolate_219 TaxID=2950110 RepID=UPI0039679873